MISKCFYIDINIVIYTVDSGNYNTYLPHGIPLPPSKFCPMTHRPFFFPTVDKHGVIKHHNRIFVR